VSQVRQTLPFLFWCLLAAGLFYALRYISPYCGISMDPALVQLVVFPFVIIAFAKVPVSVITAPRLLLPGVVLAALFTTGMGYSTIHNPQKSFRLARFSDDPYERDTRVYREALNQALALRSEIRAERFYRYIDNQDEASRIMYENPEIEAIVWKKDPWLRISISPRTQPDMGEEETPSEVERILGVRLIKQVGEVLVPMRPQMGAIYFLTSFFSGVLPREVRAALSSEVRSKQETWLIEAGSLAVPWETYSHRAYPLWELGNRKFEQAFSAAGFDMGELTCAIKAYNAALRQPGRGENGELRFAVLNNAGVAVLAYARFGREPRFMKRARQNFRAALSTYFENGRPQASLKDAEIAAANLAAISKFTKKHKKKGEKKHVKRHRH
jgi:hypothetical protein